MTPDFKIHHFLSLLEAQNENAELLHGLCKSISFSSETLDLSRRGPFDYLILGYYVLRSNCKLFFFFY